MFSFYFIFFLVYIFLTPSNGFQRLPNISSRKFLVRNDMTPFRLFNLFSMLVAEDNVSLLQEFVRSAGQLLLPVTGVVFFANLNEKQIASTEKQIASNKESTEKQIASNKESTEKQIASTEKQIASIKESTDKQIAANKENTLLVIRSFETRIENLYLLRYEILRIKK